MSGKILVRDPTVDPAEEYVITFPSTTSWEEAERLLSELVAAGATLTVLDDAGSPIDEA